jgi:tRNA-2-methylthio-N6-dimethylallyladenosine synthase
VQEVLIEGPSRTDAAVLRGRTRGNKTALVRGDAGAGSLVGVLIEGSTSQTLTGRLAPAAVPA